MLVDCHRHEADHPGVEAQGTVGIVLEHVCEDVCVAAGEDVLHCGPHQGEGEQQIAAVGREHGETSDLGNAILGKEAFDFEAPIENFKVIVHVLQQRRS